MSKKKIIAIIGVIAVILVGGFVIYKTMNGSRNDGKLQNKLEKLGKSFFEDYYYPSQERTQKDVKEFMSKFTHNGIKIDLTNLFKVSSLDKDLLNEVKVLADELKCDYNKTKIDFLPKEPYGAKDYEMTVDLECEKISKKDNKK